MEAAFQAGMFAFFAVSFGLIGILLTRRGVTSRLLLVVVYANAIANLVSSIIIWWFFHLLYAELFSFALMEAMLACIEWAAFGSLPSLGLIMVALDDQRQLLRQPVVITLVAGAVLMLLIQIFDMQLRLNIKSLYVYYLQVPNLMQAGIHGLNWLFAITLAKVALSLPVRRKLRRR